MYISTESLQGYILEEVLAFLFRSTGYKLLVAPSQDTVELDRRGNGLVVKGRGEVHQVDAVRNAVAILMDVNEKRLVLDCTF